ncbi:PRA1 family protein A3 [Raphanus sativus]|uniref:PRA1 family protein n=1 Tax=Raphanus sativus TaxID=3726 RepID=A0A6J0NQJ7_RAPSA|nr:PRA1 family protein A3 [Raphanus sativus]KAJ4898207.1 PRA1 family protein A3 [Raphanus sativus]
MDWDSVAAEDVIEALREVEWSTRPRSFAEFFSRFAFPRSFSKWTSRLKCNLYYYRTNYFILLILVLGLALITRPLAILGAPLTALSLAFLNDSFAATFNEKMVRTIRHFSPHLAAKMRPPHMPVIRGRSAVRKKVYVCGKPRLVFVLLGLTASFVLWFTSCGLLWVLYAFATALLMIILHASLRTPNLKARLNTFREEFRAVWRNYSEL